MQFDNDSDNEFQKTIWKNQNDKPAMFRLMISKPGKAPYSSKFRMIKVNPGEHVELDSEYDQAIRTEKDGIIIGGLCPWLTKMSDDEDAPVLHPALDYKQAEREIRVKDLSLKIRESKANEDAIKLITEEERKAQAIVSKGK